MTCLSSETLEDEEYFKMIDEDLKRRGITQERYLMMFPAFGTLHFSRISDIVRNQTSMEVKLISYDIKER